jgi:ribose 5-phosphate isomerase A
MTIDVFKRQAGDRAAAMVTSGNVVGLGSGSTARYATLRIAERLRAGDLHDVLGIPTSNDTAALAREAGIPLTTLEEHGEIDVTIDGADEVDPDWNVVKGLGGALLREKVVAYASRVEVMVVDDGKLVQRLGEKGPVLRLRGERPFVTDEGNWIVDCHYGPITDPAALARQIKGIPGVVEHGLFLGMVHRVVVAGADGVHLLVKP